MRKLCSLVLLTSVALAGVGCVMNLGVSKSLGRARLIEINGELYLVNEGSHRARRIEIESPEKGETINRAEVDPADD